MMESNSSRVGTVTTPFLIPVLDLLGGQVVQGKGGQRALYRPITSALCPDSDPLAVARAFRATYGLSRLYVADLDAIAGKGVALGIYERLIDDGFALLVDAGTRHAEQARPLVAAGIETIVVGLESLESPEQLGRLVEGFGERILFSLDLKEGRPLARAGSTWVTRNADEVLDEGCAQGMRRVLFLDLARVGMEEGVGTEDMARRALAREEGLEVLIGGGIRGEEDLRSARRLGVHGVLLATALHDRRIRQSFAAWRGVRDSIRL